MTDEDFDAYLESALDELEAKQSLLSDAYGLGRHERFVVDYESLTLSFFEGERHCVTARILPIATLVPVQNSLRWAWANEVFPEPVRQLSMAVKEPHSATGFDMFVQEAIECDEPMAWEIAALACKCLRKAGAYRIPHPTAHCYVLIESVSASAF
ncbi:MULTISPECIES: DUF6882 domain-containing protein [Cupriavidus]|jgi:hypothetical protein|uniref:Uncharacterized protein n=1 Tax=Cupriavidus metallidurans TaxID=119219 RepID=A0A482IKU1_9BURK|nr:MULTISPECIES: DUF6882 domain-containing protein [Cupriavidus]KWR78290.1 hypothetical protein RN01_24585 [Cupriavidus sp. SHE]QBP09715.1 hypothetical protein DDF84_008055 [Cupriavidus metallidurans]QWC90062.1 hypothetical protein KB891_07715 [Cupriavidus metallidurans]